MTRIEVIEYHCKKVGLRFSIYQLLGDGKSVYRFGFLHGFHKEFFDLEGAEKFLSAYCTGWFQSRGIF